MGLIYGIKIVVSNFLYKSGCLKQFIVIYIREINECIE